jgi:hypothetical protein
MKTLVVANKQETKSYRRESVETLIKAQIENSFQVGIDPNDIVLLTNFTYEFMGVEAIKMPLNDFCLTGSKMFALKWYLENFSVEETVHAHDLDCWANWPYEEPKFKDVGIAQYSNDKYNGGSIFWKSSAKDIIDAIINTIVKENLGREEPTLNRVLKDKKFKDRVTIVDNTFNVGCSGFVKRYERSYKPIRILHFHPYNRIAWETHDLDRNGLGEIAVSVRLERLLRRYYPFLATSIVRPKQLG